MRYITRFHQFLQCINSLQSHACSFATQRSNIQPPKSSIIKPPPPFGVLPLGRERFCIFAHQTANSPPFEGGVAGEA